MESIYTQRGKFRLGWESPATSEPFGRLGARTSRRVWRSLLASVMLAGLALVSFAAERGVPLRLLPLGDSITRGTYFARYESGPRQGQTIGLPNPEGGGWRKLLQDRLRAAGAGFDFVGELTYHSFGRDGIIDPNFDPDHHGLAGFGNRKIIEGGTVPTPPDVLEHLGVQAVIVPDIVTVLRKHRPDVILLLSGANGFDAGARDELICLIGVHSTAHLFVATLLPQRAPRVGWEKVDEYNASLPGIVAAQKARGLRVTLVDMHAAVAREDLLADGVHPNREGLAKMAATWFQALLAAGYLGPK